jgi:hypothetical protein
MGDDATRYATRVPPSGVAQFCTSSAVMVLVAVSTTPARSIRRRAVSSCFGCYLLPCRRKRTLQMVLHAYRHCSVLQPYALPDHRDPSSGAILNCTSAMR